MSHTSNAKRLNGERSCRLDVEMAKVEPPTATLAAGVLADEAIQPAFQSARRDHRASNSAGRFGKYGAFRACEWRGRRSGRPRVCADNAAAKPTR